MKIAIIVIRTLMGLIYFLASVVVLFKLAPQPEMTGLMAAAYFIPLLKVTELVCSLALLSGRFVALALVVIFPITLNIVGYHTFVDQSTPGIITGALLLASNLFLAYAHRKHYEPLFRAKRILPDQP